MWFTKIGVLLHLQRSAMGNSHHLTAISVLPFVNALNSRNETENKNHHHPTSIIRYIKVYFCNAHCLNEHAHSFAYSLIFISRMIAYCKHTMRWNLRWIGVHFAHGKFHKKSYINK